MADEDFPLWAEDKKPESADFPTSSLASLHLVDENTEHMVDNPELHSLSPLMVSSPLNQSQQQTDISMTTRPEPSPADRGKINDATCSMFTHLIHNNCITVWK